VSSFEESSPANIEEILLAALLVHFVLVFLEGSMWVFEEILLVTLIVSEDVGIPTRL